jgi:hypothetical protein
MRISLRLALLASLALGLGAAQAQTTAPTPPGTTPPATTSPAAPPASQGLSDSRNHGDRTSTAK